MSILKILRITAFLEGVSLLTLFFVTMPLKYIYNQPEWNMHVGMAHGLLFMVYVILVFMVKFEKRWNASTTLICLIASVIPFGTFYVDRKYFRQTKKEL